VLLCLHVNVNLQVCIKLWSKFWQRMQRGLSEGRPWRHLCADSS